MFLAIFCVLVLCCTGCLFCYHTRLAFKGITTNEAMRGKHKEHNPYSKGCLGNCRALWFGGTSRIYSVEPYD